MTAYKLKVERLEAELANEKAKNAILLTQIN